jgi:hypothetical protein
LRATTRVAEIGIILAIILSEDKNGY